MDSQTLPFGFEGYLDVLRLLIDRDAAASEPERWQAFDLDCASTHVRVVAFEIVVRAGVYLNGPESVRVLESRVARRFAFLNAAVEVVEREFEAV